MSGGIGSHAVQREADKPHGCALSSIFGRTISPAVPVLRRLRWLPGWLSGQAAGLSYLAG